MRNEEWLRSFGGVLEKNAIRILEMDFCRFDGFDFGRYSLDAMPERIVSFIPQ
jgi:hypothetical protein